MMLSLLGSP